MNHKAYRAAKKYGYRSGLEHKVSLYLDERNIKLRKGAKSTYGEWCEKHGFRCYDRIIPEDWLKEKGKNKHGTFIKFNGTKVKRR